MTISEKILSKESNSEAYAGDYVTAQIGTAMAQDGTAPLTIKAIKDMDGGEVWNPENIVLVMDHTIPSASVGTSSMHKSMREFAKNHNIENIYYGEGICHQLMAERGHVKPGTVVVGADSHTCTYGALGAFGTGIGSTEMAGVFLSGKLWFKVPETMKFEVTGELPKNVAAKDLALKIVGEVGADGATYKAVEYSGNPIRKMSVGERMTLTNLAVEMGAKTGIVEPDEKVRKFLDDRVEEEIELLENDEDAEFEETYYFEGDDLEPQIAFPHQVDNVKPITEAEGIKLDQVFLGTCTNGRLIDLEVAANVLEGKKIHPDTRMLVNPASKEVYKKALDRGLIETFLEAGCIVNNPGCGPCAGSHQGILAPEETCLSTANRNFKGRMGPEEAKIYLSSPITAAISAVKGEITNPQEELNERN
ncbi:3-isopropylmalate dehydratase [candidate division MSBL1 archaeon SCGC-AAA382A13]|uniref:3-isopropylmalate dehydratase large subunit n=1 Tax=candidate division MSBL1 archaeon SCGC-AAA382A13 TaxID=1698279 RepID=A0A133VD97_9EURY|nr:3-isopropylmalate dehydratase [candidate division MSBL1 archaeon SCGC-AAA382A13]